MKLEVDTNRNDKELQTWIYDHKDWFVDDAV